MKKIAIFILFIIGALLLYINYNSRNSVIDKSQSNYDDSIHTQNGELKTTPVFADLPEVYDFASLKVDPKFKPVKINLPDTITINDKKIDLSIILPVKNQFCDVFLLINKVKKDMFYQVDAGSYEFKNVTISDGLNNVEIFYRIGEKRSASSFCVIIRE